MHWIKEKAAHDTRLRRRGREGTGMAAEAGGRQPDRF
jgi:hypothetical protein